MRDFHGTREAFAQALIEISKNDDRTLLVSPDSLKAMRATEFAEMFPQRYIEVGIAEQNAIGVAAGLAGCGLIPFVATYAGFITMRACEQVRTFVAYPHLNVKMVGINGGLLGGEREGVTHQFFEDIGILRTIPGITIITPADEFHAFEAVKMCIDIDGPVYIRCASGREKRVYNKNTPFEFGKIRILKDFGNDVAIFASGFIMSRAIEATEILKNRGINATLIDVSTLKPIDIEGVVSILRTCKTAVTVEDHNIIGGLGSAISEVAVEQYPVPIVRVGLNDRFPQSGKPDELLDFYGIGITNIVKAVEKVILI